MRFRDGLVDRERDRPTGQGSRQQAPEARSPFCYFTPGASTTDKGQRSNPRSSQRKTAQTVLNQTRTQESSSTRKTGLSRQNSAQQTGAETGTKTGTKTGPKTC